ncbi:hypothetical protein IAC76_02280 [Spirochaetes bacterium]|uniref:Uncharacterized protein n=1 Tax=Candidatus Scatousia excrementipullorum TaxID=2840936 RepID=A0A9D9GZQ0_9BACT|nr:hypothetical protein [Candidatus Scatousia excrementipullorum]
MLTTKNIKKQTKEKKTLDQKERVSRNQGFRTFLKTFRHFVPPHLHFVTEAGSQGSLRSPVPFAPYKGGRTLAPFYKGGRKGGFFHVILNSHNFSVPQRLNILFFP